MNCGRANRARRKAEALQRNITGRIEKLNRLLCAALSNRNLRRSLGENAELDFPLVVKLLLMMLNGSFGTMKSLQSRRAEGCERNGDESAHHSSSCPAGFNSVAHVHSLRFNPCGRKSLHSARWKCGRSGCAANRHAAGNQQSNPHFHRKT
jgi:hypothetical protein